MFVDSPLSWQQSPGSPGARFANTAVTEGAFPARRPDRHRARCRGCLVHLPHGGAMVCDHDVQDTCLPVQLLRGIIVQSQVTCTQPKTRGRLTERFAWDVCFWQRRSWARSPWTVTKLALVSPGQQSCTRIVGEPVRRREDHRFPPHRPDRRRPVPAAKTSGTKSGSKPCSTG